jgi:pimeloyl-ACP methyl ester carboxylesterase
MKPQRDFVSVRDGRFRVEVERSGQGRPLVYLHGATGQPWAPFLNDFAEVYQVIKPVSPGWGESEGLDHLDDILDLTMFYYDLFDVLGLRSPWVIGHDFGGMIAAEIAALAPSSVSKLVLVSPAGLWLDEAPPLDLIVCNEAERNHALVYDQSRLDEVLNRPDPSDAVAVGQAHLDRTMALAATAKFTWPIWDRGLKKRAHRIKAPTLLVWGEHDGMIPPVYAGAFQRLIPNSKVAMIPETAHLPMLERPGEFVRIVSAFLES